MVAAYVRLGANDAHRIADGLHRLAPARIRDLEPQEHEDLRAVDLAGTICIEGAGDHGPDLGPAVGGLFVEAVIDQPLDDLQLRAEVDMIGDLHLDLEEPDMAQKGLVALGPALLQPVVLLACAVR